MNLPTKNEGSSDFDVLASAISKLAELRTEMANLKRFEQDYKDKITTILAQKQQDSYTSDKYFVHLKKVVSERLDTKKVKEHLGANVSEFMKVSESTRVEIKEITK
jgi:predicted phage-related endonuclease